MSTQSWEQVKELLHQALQLAPRDRSGFLDEVCRNDAELRAELESLLSAGDDLKSSFMAESPVQGVLGASFAGVADFGDMYGGSLAEGQVLAERFQLVRQLGEGGMGQVWLAEQTAPVRRPVALKLIKAGMYDAAVAQRFQAERQSLAIMDHPAIAKVFEAGATPQGQPYFVMEYVPGLPITQYCDERQLGIRARIALFMQACEGVQHAHQKAVIHRDLKPANILVVDVDGAPVPRIIDFGLARSTGPRLDDEAMHTQVGIFLGTPGYMSPEQADPAVQDIDTRTDVYSLGVILYVLLAGVRPFEPKPGQRQPLDETLRRLREEEPIKPSSRIGGGGEWTESTAKVRGMEPKQLASQLRGDLDWIAMKALEKDRSRRYGTPSELAADLGRYLNHEPVLARPASLTYQLKKYVQRHRVTAAVAAGVVLLLAGFSVLQAIQLRRITRERDRANRITDFMTGMFKVSDPNEARGKTVTAREILDKASKDLSAGLASDPEVQSELMQVMARTYLNLGLYSQAHGLAQEALNLRLKTLGPTNRNTLESRTLMGTILSREGHLADAEKMERATLADETKLLGPEDLLTLETKDHLAVTVQDEGHYAEEEKLEREVVAAATRKVGAENTQTLRAMNNLGAALWNEARYGEAEQVYRQLLETDKRALGPDHPDTLLAKLNLADALLRQGQFKEAERLQRETLAAQLHAQGPRNPDTLLSETDLARTLVREGQYGEAEKLARQAYEVGARDLGAERPDTLDSLQVMGMALAHMGRYDDAAGLFRASIAEMEKDTSSSQENGWINWYGFACVAAAANRQDESLNYLQHAVQMGFSDAAALMNDPDLKSLHPNARFKQIVAAMKSTAAKP